MEGQSRQFYVKPNVPYQLKKSVTNLLEIKTKSLTSFQVKVKDEVKEIILGKIKKDLEFLKLYGISTVTIKLRYYDVELPKCYHLGDSVFLMVEIKLFFQ